MTADSVRLASNSTDNTDLCVMLINVLVCHNVYKHDHHVIVNVRLYTNEILRCV